ncbi:MAG: FHA domain-containing protein, partial [Bdellovibrionales bacterium]|nr:FHA domain-containing protein [Bdellovibrionales bacterium]
MNQPVKLPTSPFRLKVISGPDKGAEFQVLNSKISIGRDSDNDIPLQDPKVSRKHAVIYFTDDAIQIVNVSQQNKLYVNGVEAENAVTEPGGHFQIGNSRIDIIQDVALNTTSSQSAEAIDFGTITK